MPLKIVVIQRILPPYRVGPLDLVAEKLAEQGGQLIVVHGDPNPRAAAEARQFRSVRVRSWELAGAVLLNDLHRAVPWDSDLVVAEFGLKLVGLPGFMRRARARGIPFAWWGSGWEQWREQGPGWLPGLRRWRRRQLLLRAAGVLSYGRQAREFYIDQGADSRSVWVVPNTIDTRGARAASSAAEERFADPDEARGLFGLAGKKVLLFVGRLLSYKRVDRLIEAVARSPLGDLHALIVGAGPERVRLELLAGRLAPDRIHFVGAINDPDRKAALFRAADVLVLPAQAGLAVNDALARGLPVICGSRQGPELEALVDGENGLFVDGAGPRSLDAAITRFFADPQLRDRLRVGARQSRGFDVEDFAQAFIVGAQHLVTTQRDTSRPSPQRDTSRPSPQRDTSRPSPQRDTSRPSPQRQEPARPLLVMGPLPPPVHGVAVMFQTLLDRLSGDIALHHVPVGDPQKGRSFGVFTARNAWVALQDLARGVLALRRVRPHTAYLSLSQNRWAFLRDAVLILTAHFSGVYVVAHLHGAHFGDFRGRASWPLRRFIDLVLGRTDRVVVLGECLRSILGPAVPPDRIRVVPNGIDLPASDAEQCRSATRQTSGQPFHMLFMGVLDETKGFRELIRALPELRAACPGAFLTLAGRWESELLRAEVAAEIGSLGLEDAVEFTGVVLGEEKTKLFAAADLLALPTYYPLEGLPVVILEAMAAGCPVVATARGAIAEVVNDQETGLIVPERDHAALVAALVRLATDQELRAAMGSRARDLHQRRYTAAHFADNLKQVFLGLGSSV